MVHITSVAHLVVLGASAGGIEVLSTLVEALPADFPAPLVIAQHLDPTRPSHLAEILGRHTALPIHSVTTREPLVPGTIYLAPPNCHLLITKGAIEPVEEGPGRSKPSIDLALSSAAAAYGEQLIAVILSGTGSDGAAGARLVKQSGGTVLIQDPSTAAYPGMALALAPTTVDLVATPERLGPLLSQLLSGVAVPTQPEARHTLDAFLLELRARTGLDFTQYKKPTILRRLHRRMVATDCAELTEYFTYVHSHPEEYRLLVQSFLINVTEFFRDPEVFRVLREQGLPDLLAYARTHGGTLRCWSAGCATGEEAYSLAMLVAEALGSELEQFQVRIFATDVDPEAIAFARRGVYPLAAFADVPEELVSRYFTRDEDHYTAKKRLRSLLIFGQHDLSQGAPFPQLDLVLCRNVLIYFTPDLQERALQLFAYALREGGLLVLGKAEAPPTLSRSFQVQDKAAKVFRRHGARLGLPVTPRAAPLAAPPPHFTLPRVPLPDAVRKGQKERPAARTLQEQALHTLPVGVVVVDRHYDIQAINPAARRVFSIHNLALGEDLVHLAQAVPSTPLRSALDAAFREGVTTTLAEMTLEQVDPTQPHTFQFTILPQREEAASGPVETALVLVQEITPLVEARQALQQQIQETRQEFERFRQDAAAELARTRAEATAEQQRREELIRGLVETNRRLQEANQELTSTTEELRTANEELVVGMEEAQAAVEEVETLNEELQASNEEMETLNEELQATVEELHTTNEDLQARGLELHQLAHASQEERARLAGVLQSMQDAVLVVNERAEPLLTNQAYVQTFGSHEAQVVAHDAEGHPLAPEATPQQRAARGEVFTLEFTLPTSETRRFFEATGSPLRDEEGRLMGGVIVLRDITERSLHRLQDEFIALAGHELRAPLTILKLALHLTGKRLQDQPPVDPGRQSTERMLAQVGRMEGLITDLLDVGRLQRGIFQIHLEPLQLEPLVVEVVEAAQELTQQLITLEMTGGPFTLQGDAGRLEQVLLNLLTNAITYAPQSPQIAVRVRRVGQEAELQVQDAGPGIAADQLPHLFSRYYQVEHQGPTRSTGLGLGLYIVKEIVTQHGGQISVTSSEGQGATFTVRLPLASNDEARPPAAQDQLGHGQSQGEARTARPSSAE
jgi:two-component system CheB/CheR fusion protein